MWNATCPDPIYLKCLRSRINTWPVIFPCVFQWFRATMREIFRWIWLRTKKIAAIVRCANDALLLECNRLTCKIMTFKHKRTPIIIYDYQMNGHSIERVNSGQKVEFQLAVRIRHQQIKMLQWYSENLDQIESICGWAGTCSKIGISSFKSGNRRPEYETSWAFSNSIKHTHSDISILMKNELFKSSKKYYFLLFFSKLDKWNCFSFSQISTSYIIIGC